MPGFIPDFATDSPFWETVIGLGIFLGAVAVAWIANLALTLLTRHVTSKTKNQLDDIIVRQLRVPLVLLIWAQGLFIAATTLSYLDSVQRYVNMGWFATVMAVTFFGIYQLVNGILRWYENRVMAKSGGQAGDNLLPLLRRCISGALLALGTLVILDNLGIEISPLLAGLGIGGLAVALALQPSLSNFFAGTYVVSGNVLKVGDFIELEGGVRGYVLEVGWRSTRIRTPFNNLVVIPNSRLADSILTNYFGPSMEMGVMVEVGVSYSSDLARVREVALEEANRLVQEMPEAVKTFTPFFGYERFGDSNVDLWLWMQATSRSNSFALKTEMMIRLHQRFTKEGIEINYPVRQLLFPPQNGVPPAIGGPDGQ